MFWLDFAVAFLVAGTMTWILVGLAGWRTPRAPDAALWPSLVFVFAVGMVLIWAGGAWLTPFGPALFGAHWAPFVVVGVVFGLVLAATGAAQRPPRTGRENQAQQEVDTQVDFAARSIFGVFFWILVAVVFSALLVRYG